MFFVTDGIAKGVGTLSSNFIGAEQPQLIGSVFRKTFGLINIFACFYLLFLVSSKPLVRFFTSDTIFFDPVFQKQLITFFAWYWLLFIIDSLRHSVIYFMFALTKTTVILVYNIVFYWGLILLPAYYLIVKRGLELITYVQLSALECMIVLIIFNYWFKRGTWMKTKKI